MPLPPSPIGFDASVLINFCEVGRLDLLIATCAPPRYVLADVLRELSPSCRTRVHEICSRNAFSVAHLQSRAELERWARYTLRLDAGESATLAAAAEHGWSVAVDDRAARRLVEQELGRERLTGTVGILVAAVEQGHLTKKEADALLRKMVAAGYWAPVSSVSQAMACA